MWGTAALFPIKKRGHKREPVNKTQKQKDVIE